MRKAFLFAKTDSVVVLNKRDRRLRSVIDLATDRTVIVKTPGAIGGAMVIADRLITSLLLVGNYERVVIRFYRGKNQPAFVIRRNTELNLAELVPVDRSLALVEKAVPLVSSPSPKIGQVGGIGNPLLVVNTENGTHSARVGGALYLTRLSGRFEESWRIKSQAPRGLIGGGVWDTEGFFIGLTIGEKIQPALEILRKGHSALYQKQIKESGEIMFDPAEEPIPSVYALLAEDVMNFAESSN